MSHKCFFIGHADAPRSIYPMLKYNIRQYITVFGVKSFLVGHYGSFDSMVISALKETKEKYVSLDLQLITPYHPAERRIDLPDGFDSIYYPFILPPPKRYAIVRANEKLIDECDFLISYVSHIGKSRDFLERAYKRERKGQMHIVNLAAV